jgi:D-alanyl-D-alanine carboxypeptidase/D-alanyl-D-alanine-endopeptidase (penicillin-binding protein 4)
VALAVAGVLAAGLLPRFEPPDVTGEVRGLALPPPPALDLHAPPPAAPVLATADAGAAMSPEALRAHLAKALARPGLGRRVGFAVTQLGVPSAHWSAGAAVVTPASTMKLLTTTAALAVLGPAHRFTTSVVQGATPSTLVLKGGGDPLLVAALPSPAGAGAVYPVPATLADLARSTAHRLARRGIDRVRLGYDASLFTGPAVNPRWPATYIPENVVSPISALWVNEGREQAGYAARSADPAAAAAADFAELLGKSGITVAGPVTEQAAPAGQNAVASVESPPLQQIVEHILEVSDNEGAEVLLRQVALATGRPGSSAAGVSAVRATLTRLGLDLDRATIYDGSGLSRDDRLPVDLLIGVLQAAASPAHPDLRGVVDGLPVAGFSGSLAYRFVDDAPGGLGYVRAKTGTLTGVHGLAGLAMTRDGQVAVFAVVADRVPVPKTLRARDDLDRIAAALSTCGC